MSFYTSNHTKGAKAFRDIYECIGSLPDSKKRNLLISQARTLIMNFQIASDIAIRSNGEVIDVGEERES